MTISQTQLVDILFKKLNGVSKTDTSTAKSYFNEANASPALSPGSTVWQQDYLIPVVTTLPTSNSSVVSVYRQSTSSSIQAAALSESVAQESWTTGLTNWIPPQYGAGYQVQLYAGPAGSSTPQNFTNLPVAGSGNNDSWYFNYQAGIVNFADTNVPTAVSNVSNVVYVVGARYVGTTGVTNYGNLTIGNISINGNTISGNAAGVTITGNVTTGNVITNNFFYGNGAPIVFSNYGNANVTALLSGFGSNNISTTGNVTAGYFLGNAAYLTGLPATHTNANVISLLSNFGSNSIVTTGTVSGNVIADTVTPYQTQVTVFNSNTAIGLPVGSSTTYPTANSAGYIRFNNTIGTVEFYSGSAWQPLTNTISDQQRSEEHTSELQSH